ncbi:PaaI family thioesterase [Chachezhania sediminis]|uniref:PaaI family thioesterase n=1 Tax=Chachezhania sediminis TaxID=2599291 RepID=UPI00131B884C|nr:PaaI family thioesterase [Chachezhania sediminis]
MDPLARLTEELTRPPFNAWLGLRAVTVEPDRVQVALPFRPELAGGTDPYLFHGGILASLADVAGYAVSAIATGGRTPTIGLHIEYLRPASPVDLIATATVRRLGRSLLRVDVEIHADNSLVAIARGNFTNTGGAQ